MADLILSIELDPSQIERNIQNIQARVGQGIGQAVAQTVQQSARQISEAAERAIRQTQRVIEQLDRQIRQRRISLFPPTERVEARGEQLIERVRQLARMKIITEEEAAKRIAQIQTETAEWRWRQEMQTATRQLAQLDRILQRRRLSFLPPEEQIRQESERLTSLVRELHERGVLSAAEAAERISRIQSIAEQQRTAILAREEARREQARARELARQARQVQREQRLLELAAERERQLKEREAERNRRMLEREAERQQRFLQRQQAEITRFDRELERRRLSILPPSQRVQAEADMLIARVRELVNRRVITEQEGARRIEEIQRQAAERRRQIEERGLPFTGGRVSIQAGILAVATAFAFATRIVERFFGLIADRIQEVRELQERLLEISAVIATFDRTPGTFLERFATARGMADEILKRLIEIDARTVGTLDDVLKVFQALIQTGIEVKEALDVTEVLTNAIIAITRGQDKERQLYTEIYALVDGQVRAGSRLARIIRDQGVDLDRQIPLWIATNRFAEEISQRLAGFAIAGEEFGKTITGLVTRIQSQLKLLTLETFTESVEATKSALEDVLLMIGRQRGEIREIMRSISQFSVVLLEGMRLLGRGLLDIFAGPVTALIKGITNLLAIFPREVAAATVAIMALLAVLVPASTTILFLSTAAGTLSKSLALSIARFGAMTLAGSALTGAMAALAGRFDQVSNQVARSVIGVSALVAGIVQLKTAISTIIAVGAGFVPILRILFAAMSLFTGLSVILRTTRVEASGSQRSLEGIVESIDAIRARLHVLETTRKDAGKGAIDTAYINQLLVDSVIALTASEKLQIQNLKDRQKQEEYLRAILQRRLEQEKALAGVQLGQKLRELSTMNERLANQWREFEELAALTGQSIERTVGKTHDSMRKSVVLMGTTAAFEISKIGYALSDSTQQAIKQTEKLAREISEITPAFERELNVVIRTAQALDLKKEQLIELARASGATEDFIQKLSVAFDEFSKTTSQSSRVVSSFVFQIKQAFEQGEEFRPDLSESLIRTRERLKELAVEFQNVRRWLETEPVGAEKKPLPPLLATREAARLLGKQLDELRHRVRVFAAQGEDAFEGLTEEQRRSILAAFQLREQMELTEQSIRRTSRPMRTFVDFFEQARERLNSLMTEISAFSGKMSQIFRERLHIEIGIERLEAVRSLIDRIIKSKAILGEPIDLGELRVPDPEQLLKNPKLLAETIQRLEIILGEVTARTEAWRQQQERALEPMRARLEWQALQQRHLEREMELETRIGIERERARIQLAEEIENLRARNALLQEAERRQTILGAQTEEILKLWAEETIRQENLQLAQELRRRRSLTDLRERMRDETLLRERARVERLEALEETDRQRIIKEQALAARIETINRELAQRLADIELDRQTKRLDQILELIATERDLAQLRSGDATLRAIAVEESLVQRRRQQLETAQSAIAQEAILNALRRRDVVEQLAAAEADLEQSRREAIATLEQLMVIEARLARFRAGDPELRAAVLDAERLRRRKEELQVLENMIIVEEKLRKAGEIRTEVLNAKVLEHLKNAKDLTEILQDAQLNLFQSIESAFDNVIDRATQKLGIFRNFVSTLLKDLAQLIIRQIIGPLFSGLGKAIPTISTTGVSSPATAQTAANTAALVQQQGQTNTILNTIASGIQQAIGVLSNILSALSGTMSTKVGEQVGTQWLGFFTQSLDKVGQTTIGTVGIVTGSIAEQLIRVQQLLVTIIQRLEAILQALVTGTTQGTRGVMNFTRELLGALVPSARAFPDLLITHGFPTARIPTPGGTQRQPAGGLGARLGQTLRNLVTSPHFLSSMGLALGAVLGGPGATGFIGGIAGGIVGWMIGKTIAGAMAGGTSVLGSVFGMMTTAATAIPFFGALATLIAMPFIGRTLRRGREKREAARTAEQMFANIRAIIEQVRLDLIEGEEARQYVQEQWAQWETFIRTTLKDRTVQERSLATQRPFFEQHLAWLESEILAQQRRKVLGQRAVPEFQRGGLVPFLAEPGELVIPPNIADVVGLDTLNVVNAVGLRGIDLPTLIKILIALIAAGRVPGTKTGRDSVAVLGQAGSFVINRRVSDELARLLPKRIAGGALFNVIGSINAGAKLGNIPRYQTGGSVSGLPTDWQQLLALLIPVLLQLLNVDPKLVEKLLPLLLALISGNSAVVTDQLKQWIIAWLSSQPLFKSLPESVRQQITNTITGARTFQQLIQALATPQFLADLGSALFSRLPLVKSLPPHLREIATSLMSSLILARGDVRSVLRSPATLGVITQALLKSSPLFSSLSDEEKQKILGAIQLGFHPSGFQPQAIMQIVGTLLPGVLQRFGAPSDISKNIAAAVVGLLQFGLARESPFQPIIAGALPMLPLAMIFASMLAQRNRTLGLLTLFSPFLISAINVRRRQREGGGTPGQPPSRQDFMRTIRRWFPILAIGGLTLGLLPRIIRTPGGPPGGTNQGSFWNLIGTVFTQLGTIATALSHVPTDGTGAPEPALTTIQKTALPMLTISAPSASRPVGFGVGFAAPAFAGGGGELAPVSIAARTGAGPVVLNISNFIVVGAQTAREMVALAADDIVTIVEARSRRRG